MSSPSPEAVRALLEGPERLSYTEVAARLGTTRDAVRWVARTHGIQASAAPGRKPKAKLETAHLPEATRAPLRAALELVDAAPSPASREAAIGILLERVREFVASNQ